MTFRYFAYGSNLLHARLAVRCPSLHPIGRAAAPGFRVAFDKRGADGSGKATLIAEADGMAEGVVWEIDLQDRPRLDAAEGDGYARCDDFSVVVDGTPASVTTYIAKVPEAGLRPFDWYLGLVLAGAVEHGLAEDTVAAYRGLAWTADPCADRPGRLVALDALPTDWARLLA